LKERVVEVVAVAVDEEDQLEEVEVELEEVAEAVRM
jgi:hypothetical protein